MIGSQHAAPGHAEGACPQDASSIVLFEIFLGLAGASGAGHTSLAGQASATTPPLRGRLSAAF